MSKSGTFDNPFVGKWTYRSLYNQQDVDLPFTEANFLFGKGTIDLKAIDTVTMGGTIGGPGWSLNLHGSIAYGTPMQVRFEGRGVVSGAEWVYDYIGWLVPVWPNSNARLQTQAIVGSVVRTIPHPASKPGTIAPAGVTASFYAVRAD